MIAALFLLITASEPPAEIDPAQAERIEVIGRKLETWRGNVKNRDGVPTCDIKQSTGDAEIDQIGCDAMVSCIMDIKPQLDAAAASDLPRKERSRRMKAMLEVQGPCVMERRETAIDALAQKRADAL